VSRSTNASPAHRSVDSRHGATGVSSRERQLGLLIRHGRNPANGSPCILMLCSPPGLREASSRQSTYIAHGRNWQPLAASHQGQRRMINCVTCFGRIDLGQENDNYGWLFVQSDPLRIHVGTHYHARMLVPRLPISRSGQRHGQRLLPHGELHCQRSAARLPQHRRQRQRDAPAVLRGLWHTAIQRGRSASPSYFRSSWNAR
jgi:hypothetical protein